MSKGGRESNKRLRVPGKAKDKCAFSFPSGINANTAREWQPYHEIQVKIQRKKKGLEKKKRLKDEKIKTYPVKNLNTDIT